MSADVRAQAKAALEALEASLSSDSFDDVLSARDELADAVRSLDVEVARLDATLEYVEKGLDNVRDLDGDLGWTNDEVVELYDDLRVLLTGGTLSGTVPVLQLDEVSIPIGARVVVPGVGTLADGTRVAFGDVKSPYDVAAVSLPLEDVDRIVNVLAADLARIEGMPAPTVRHRWKVRQMIDGLRSAIDADAWPSLDPSLRSDAVRDDGNGAVISGG